MKIVVKKGLNIPLSGKPVGAPQELSKPDRIALNINPFEEVRFKVLVKQGDEVKIGEPLLESKLVPGQMFVSPASGTVLEVRRGLKRRLLDIIISVAEKESHEEHPPLSISAASREQLIEAFLHRGLFPHIRLRPFNLVPDPKWEPRAIFVNGAQTLPFVPPYEGQIEQEGHYFQQGLDVLTKLTKGKVHLVFDHKTSFAPFLEAKGVEKHTVEGPHPAGTSSLHIHKIDPILHPEDYVWTLTALDAVIIGKMIAEGRYHTSRLIAVAGDGVADDKRGFFKGRMGFPLDRLLENRINVPHPRLISGDPLTGSPAEMADFLAFFDTCVSVIPENTYREPFHFLRPGFDKYSATRTYMTGHKPPPPGGYDFTTNQHGEERAFIDGEIYYKVMPMRIPTMQLIKAILAEDYELAEQLGLLEVVPEDFALSTFICPSKIEMVDIVRQGLYRYAKEMGH